MKNKIISIITGALVFATLSTTAFASTAINHNDNAKIGDVMTEEQENISKNFLKNNPYLMNRFNEVKISNTQKTTSQQILKGPAAKLTDYYTYFVAYTYNSSDKTYNNYEDVRNKFTTTNDFNGTIYVATVEVGYGRESASFNGNSLSKYDDVLLDFNGDRIIDGFVDVWKIDNVTSGKFSSNATSTNFDPNHTAPFYTGINIQ